MFIFLSISMYYLVNIPIGRLYMHHMSNGAKLNGMTIELCTPYLRHTLSALEMPPVTFVSTQFRNTPTDLFCSADFNIHGGQKESFETVFVDKGEYGLPAG